jgi:hypothetical protein
MHGEFNITFPGRIDKIMHGLAFFFLIKCKNIIDQKGAGVQQYKEKGNKVL